MRCVIACILSIVYFSFAVGAVLHPANCEGNYVESKSVTEYNTGSFNKQAQSCTHSHIKAMGLLKAHHHVAPSRATKLPVSHLTTLPAPSAVYLTLADFSNKLVKNIFAPFSPADIFIKNRVLLI